MLVDSFGRVIKYIRLSVTNHCNYHCYYCREDNHKIFSDKKNILSFEEIVRVIKIFAELGVNKVRLTGGEPLLRKDLDKLAKYLSNINGIKELPLSTNAHLLDLHAQKLYNSGVTQANISLDSLNEKIFNDITRGGDLNRVLSSIAVAKKVGMKVKINMVVMDNVNTEEIIPMLKFAIDNDLELRYIETMPIGSAGVKALTENHFSSETILTVIENEFGPSTEILKSLDNTNAGPARMFDASNHKFGIISAISDEFCMTCNRLRISADGKLILCLGQENSLNLKQLLRTNTTDNTIRQEIINAVNKKPKKHYFNNDVNNIANRQMVEIGG